MEILPIDGLWIGQADLASVNSVNATEELSDAIPFIVPLILSLPPESATEQPQLLDEVSVMLTRDGRMFNRRFISTLFHEPATLTEAVPLTISGATGTLTGTIMIPDDHAVNPYRHRYHPEHTTGYEITREIELVFGAEVQSATDPV